MIAVLINIDFTIILILKIGHELALINTRDNLARDGEGSLEPE
jgi:hypothetical protein